MTINFAALHESVVGNETDMPTPSPNVRSQRQSGKHMLALSFSAFDAKADSGTRSPASVHVFIFRWSRAQARDSLPGGCVRIYRPRIFAPDRRRPCPFSHTGHLDRKRK
jgi:hypothetical protein